MEILGFSIKRKSREDESKQITFSPKEDQENSVEVLDYGAGAIGGAVASFMDLTHIASSETELINRYRGMASQPEIAAAIDHIINEMVFVSDDDSVVSVITDELDYTDKVKEKITEEFNALMELMDFSNNAYEIIRRWYVDGVLRYHAVIDEGKEHEGIKALRYIDPRKIKKVRVYEEVPIKGTMSAIQKRIKEDFFVYSETGFNTVTDDRNALGGYNIRGAYSQEQVKISKDAIVSAVSGLMDSNNKFVLSYLDQAFRPLNSLRIEEDATVIYRVSRAPERRAFYIDVSGMPPSKAQAHVKQMMDSHNKKMQYNSKTGEIVDSQRVMTMTDDYWLPRKDGSRGTEIVPLQGGQNLGEMEDVIYFQKALYKALKVPVSRLESETGSFLGRQSEISREEQNFALFIGRLRAKFTTIFDEMLERQLILKKIIKEDEWKKVRSGLRYDFKKNNFFEELREAEVLRERISLLTEAEQFVGKYVSREWAMKKILNFTDDEIADMQKEIEDGKAKGYYDDFSDTDSGNGENPFDEKGFEDDEPGGGGSLKAEKEARDAGEDVPPVQPKSKKPDALNNKNDKVGEDKP